MERILNKIKNIEHKKEIMLIIIIFLFLAILSIYKTFATDMTVSNSTSSNTDLSYTFNLNDNTTKEVTITANSSKYLNFNLHNPNDGNINYQLAYSIKDAEDYSYGLRVDETSDSIDKTYGLAKANSIKDITIRISNATSDDLTIVLDVITGYENGGDLKERLGEGQYYVNSNDNIVTYLYSIFEDEYQDITKTTAGETIKLAKGINMMKDSVGNLRYYGENPSNYLTFNGEEAKWRIVGIFKTADDKDNITSLVKLVREDSIGKYYYDNKSINLGSSTTNNGSNKWQDARLMMLLNDESLSDSSLYELTPGLYYNSQIGNCYHSDNNLCNFETSGLTDEGITKIAKVKLNLGTSIYNNYSYQAYQEEQKENSNTWTGYVSLLYPSDYEYASDLSICQQTTASYSSDKNNCLKSNWLYQQDKEWSWLLSPSNENDKVYRINNNGDVDYQTVNSDGNVYPVVYLKSDINITGGTGTKTDPYTID